MRGWKFVGVILVLLLVFFFTYSCTKYADHDRIERKVESRGGQLVDVDVSYVGGPYWYRSKSDRVYSFTWKKGGHTYEGWVKFSLWSSWKLQYKELDTW